MPSLCSMPTGPEGVALAQRAVVLEQVFGRQEQADALRRRRGRRAGGPAPGGTMLSVASWSPQVMKIFWPFRAVAVPSPSGVGAWRSARPGRCPPAARSAPWRRSIRRRPASADTAPSGARCRAACSASMAASVSMGHRPKAMLAACTISKTASSSALGRPWPPCSGSADRPVQPPAGELAIGVGEAGRGGDRAVGVARALLVAHRGSAAPAPARRTDQRPPALRSSGPAS